MPPHTPSLSVRAFAELLRLPAVQQVRILNDQKYPNSEPQSFRVPYYQPALKGIRDFYRGGGAPALASARAAAMQLAPPARRDHNLRVLEQFAAGQQPQRTLAPATSPKLSTTVSGVTIRLQFDLVAVEGDVTRYILYNLRNEPVDAEVARCTLEIAHWVMQREGVDVPPQALEQIEIATGISRPGRPVRQRTIQNVEQNASVIQTLWPTI
jgi:hypothetical protein